VLTDTKVRQAKARQKPYKLADEAGLYLYVSPAGAKSWRYDYRLHGKRETLTLGRYPDVSLAGENGARERHREARKLVEKGESPARVKQIRRRAAAEIAGDTVKALAESWYSQKAQYRSSSWQDNVRRWLDQDVYPAIGSWPVMDVKPADVLDLVRRVANERGQCSAEYLRQMLAQVYEHAIRNLRATTNPARDVRGAIERPAPKRRPPLSANEIPAFLGAVDAYPGRLSTKLAIKLLLLTFVRKSELIGATWDEIDFDRAEWRIPGERMKMRDPHIVPLSRQAVEAFRELKALASGSEYVLPNLGSLKRPMGASSLNVAFERMGYGERFTPHGVRATASTILNEQGFRPDVIERQLAHTERNRIRAAYNHADYLEERGSMMQQFADYIDGLCAGADVTPIRRVA
jgi:integrase